MSVEKQLHLVREKINKLLPMLEEFVQENYQPLSSDAEMLKKMLNELNDEIVVYLHYISKKEISSSFQIHQAVSKFSTEENKGQSLEIPKASTNISSSQKDSQLQTSNIPSMDPPHVIPIPLSINDKYIILKKLFKNSQIEWESAFHQFSICQTKTEILDYLHSLRDLYGWNINDDAYQILEKACLKKFT